MLYSSLQSNNSCLCLHVSTRSAPVFLITVQYECEHVRSHLISWSMFRFSTVRYRAIVVAHTVRYGVMVMMVDGDGGWWARSDEP